MFAVCVKSAIGVLVFAGECDLGESCKMIPPGPLGTAWKDFPKNLIDAGIPVAQLLVMSSNVVSGPFAVCLCCILCNFPSKMNIYDKSYMTLIW